MVSSLKCICAIYLRMFSEVGMEQEEDGFHVV